MRNIGNVFEGLDLRQYITKKGMSDLGLSVGNFSKAHVKTLIMALAAAATAVYGAVAGFSGIKGLISSSGKASVTKLKAVLGLVMNNKMAVSALAAAVGALALGAGVVKKRRSKKAGDSVETPPAEENPVTNPPKNNTEDQDTGRASGDETGKNQGSEGGQSDERTPERS